MAFFNKIKNITFQEERGKDKKKKYLPQYLAIRLEVVLKIQVHDNSNRKKQIFTFLSQHHPLYECAHLKNLKRDFDSL